MNQQLTREVAGRFAKIVLAHITREYPGKMDHVLTGPADVQNPRALHPAFYGSFDWHSCVHGFWLMATILRRFPDLEQASAIRGLFDNQLSAANIAAELRYLHRPLQENFERPYGWAWLLALSSELDQNETAHARGWFDTLRPFAEELATRFKQYLTRLPYPIRGGTHPNTAFAAALVIEYAEIRKDNDLLNAVCERVKAFFAADSDCQAWEPNGNDFHSPTLMVMECMRRALPPADFVDWVGRYLPRLSQREPRVLFEPVPVADHSDAQIGHLDGLNFSRAWCWRAFARVLPDTDPRRTLALEAAERHINQSFSHLQTDYAGEHWLATYATLALTA
jgi:hypothetical protein